MAEATHLSIADEKMQYVFTPELKRKLMISFGVGLALFVLGIIFLALGIGEGGHGAATEGHALAAGGGGEEHAYHWSKRVWANLWLCSVYFTGIALVGVFFVAINYVAWAGWSALIKRVPEAFGYFLPIMGVLLLVLFFVAGHDLFHWTHTELYEENSHEYDKIIAGKQGFFYFPLSGTSGFPVFFLFRMFLYFGTWFGLFYLIRQLSLKEDRVTDFKGYLKNPDIYNRAVYISAVFIVSFAAFTSMAAWDWVMSIDTHWFSTMFGWYNFASWFVAGLSTITLAVVFLKDEGYFKMVSKHHLHDLGKFMFAFSVFWTYIWFSQFLLIYYAHLPEETVYFDARLFSPTYRPIFFLNIFINFVFPFLILMTRESKRTTIFLKIVAIALLSGHYIDFYMMIMPGTVGEHGGFGFVEFGCILIFVSAFIYVFASTLSKVPLIPKNHPFLKESMHFTQF